MTRAEVLQNPCLATRSRKGSGSSPSLALAQLLLGQHRLRAGLQHAVEPEQHRERQDHHAVVALHVIAPQNVGHAPDEGREVLPATRLGAQGGGACCLRCGPISTFFTCAICQAHRTAPPPARAQPPRGQQRRLHGLVGGLLPSQQARQPAVARRAPQGLQGAQELLLQRLLIGAGAGAAGHGGGACGGNDAETA